MKKNKPLTIVFLFALCLLQTNASNAQSGSLDLSFDADGKVSTAVGTSNDEAYSTAIQTDGKILVAGSSRNGAYDDFAVVRYNPNGSLDTSFDNDGKVTTAIGTLNDIAYSMAIQSDGKIVIAGSSAIGNDFHIAVVRYNTNGSLDSTFDSDGIAITAVGSSDVALSLAIQSDGKIVIAGYCYNNFKPEIVVVRYNNNGSLDNSFDNDGKVTTAVGALNDVASSIAIQSDGKIVVAGNSYNGNDNDFAVVRYTVNGSLDGSFDNDGKLTTAIGPNNDYAYALAIQSDGKIVVAGPSNDYYNNNYNNSFSVVRYNTNGSLDSSFDSDGKISTHVGASNDVARAIAIQNDGKILVAGTTDNVGNTDFAVVRYNTNGSLDTSFDFDGTAATSVGQFTDNGTSLAIQSDGKIVLAGAVHGGIYYDFAVVRYNNSISNGVGMVFNQNPEVTIYPNPFSTQTILQSSKPLQNATLSVYNCLGALVNQLNNISGQTVIIEGNNLPTGLYFISLTQNNKAIATQKLIITD